MGLLDTLLGNTSTSRLKKLQPYIKQISDMEPQMQAMTDEQLRAQTALFRERLKNGETLDDIMVEAFATVREAAVRTVDMRHFRRAAARRHGAASGPYLRDEDRRRQNPWWRRFRRISTRSPAQGVHMVTVNDYLAKRDAQWMGKIYRFLGMSVGCVVNGMERVDKAGSL